MGYQAIEIFSSSSDDDEGEGWGGSQCGRSLKRSLVSRTANEVTVIEKPLNFITGARKKRKGLQKSEETVDEIAVLNDECCILDHNPEKIVAVCDNCVNDSEELAVTAERGHVCFHSVLHCCTAS
eukprot:Gb_21324 [translate_table: standard]